MKYEIGGHTFSWIITNTQGLHTDLYIVGGDTGDLSDMFKGEFRFGFNIDGK